MSEVSGYWLILLIPVHLALRWRRNAKIAAMDPLEKAAWRLRVGRGVLIALPFGLLLLWLVDGLDALKVAVSLLTTFILMPFCVLMLFRSLRRKKLDEPPGVKVT